MPTVSVIIPVFNGERFIGEAIQSVLEQTLQDLEIIVVDDGSTDDTGKAVRQFSAPISYYRQENQGAGVARNLGVSLARAEWVAFVDADDLWYPKKLAMQMEHVKRCPEADLFYTDMDAVDENGNIIAQGLLKKELERREKRGRANLISLAFGNRPFPRPSTVLLRKEVFLKAGGFNPIFRKSNHEDFDLFARMAQICVIVFIGQSLAKYRVHSTQGTRDSANSDEQWLMLLHCLWETYRNEPEKQTKLLHYYARYFCNRGKDFMIARNYREARRCFSLAFRYEPLYKKIITRWLLSYLPIFREFYAARKRGPRTQPYKDIFRQYY
jgi:glycosyltransferase involved in cell wall biosynthesis